MNSDTIIPTHLFGIPVVRQETRFFVEMGSPEDRISIVCTENVHSFSGAFDISIHHRMYPSPIACCVNVYVPENSKIPPEVALRVAIEESVRNSFKGRQKMLETVMKSLVYESPYGTPKEMCFLGITVTPVDARKMMGSKGFWVLTVTPASEQPTGDWWANVRVCISNHQIDFFEQVVGSPIEAEKLLKGLLSCSSAKYISAAMSIDNLNQSK